MVQIHAVQNGPCAESILRDRSSPKFQLHTDTIMLPDPYSLRVIKVVLYIENTDAYKITAPRHHRQLKGEQSELGSHLLLLELGIALAVGP